MSLNLDVVGRTIEAPDFNYDWQAVATYALGIGAGPEALDYVWEGAEPMKVVPSFAVVPTMPIVMKALRDVGADFRKLVHGEQTILLHRPIAHEGTLHTTGRISNVWDKGKGAVVIIETETRDDRGPLFDTTWSIFCRGQGDFGGERGPTPNMPAPIADAVPALAVTAQTAPNQALVYRLSGDLNPLHVDPGLASNVGFEGPILHGLCTYGFATRAVVDVLCDGDPARLKRFQARFSDVVYPGDALQISALPSEEPGEYLLSVRVGDRTVLSHGIVEIA